MSDFDQVSADCRMLKHWWCSGNAWNNFTDQAGDCECNCHGEQAETV